MFTVEPLMFITAEVFRSIWPEASIFAEPDEFTLMSLVLTVIEDLEDFISISVASMVIFPSDAKSSISPADTIENFVISLNLC